MTSREMVPVEQPGRIYPLYLPGPVKFILFPMLVALTLLGVLMIAGVFSDPQSRVFGSVCLVVVGVLWFKVLTIPHRIEVKRDGTFTFVSLLRRIQVSPQSVRSIKPASSRLGFFVLKHSGGTIHLLGQFDGFHEFLSALRISNPGVELRGC
jgi:hypothetical protein